MTATGRGFAQRPHIRSDVYYYSLYGHVQAKFVTINPLYGSKYAVFTLGVNYNIYCALNTQELLYMDGHSYHVSLSEQNLQQKFFLKHMKYRTRKIIS